MVGISKPFLKKIITKNLEYQDYNNYITIFITIIVSLFMLLISSILLKFEFLKENPIWIIIILLLFISFEIIFFILIFYLNRQKQDKKKEIDKLR